jgi:hypothetical protein
MVGDMADAVVVPGGMFGPAAGLLMYAAAVAERRGATVHRHSWTGQPTKPFEPDIEAWVREEIRPLIDAVGGRPMLIGKSLGTNAATLAAERRMPAVWLTPILTVPWVAAALGRATAPFLVVGGTADTMWGRRHGSATVTVRAGGRGRRPRHVRPGSTDELNRRVGPSGRCDG